LADVEEKAPVLPHAVRKARGRVRTHTQALHASARGNKKHETETKCKTKSKSETKSETKIRNSNLKNKYLPKKIHLKKKKISKKNISKKKQKKTKKNNLNQPQIEAKTRTESKSIKRRRRSHVAIQ
jgi:hypothetical protein